MQPRRLEGTKARTKGFLRAFVSSWLPFFFVVSASSLSAHAPVASWPQFRGNPRLTGVAATEPPETLKLRWTYEAGESIESSAAIVDGTVYVGSAKGELLAIDLE